MKIIVSLLTITLLSCTAEEAPDEIETSVDNNDSEIQTMEIETENQIKTNPGESVEYYPNGAVKM